MSDRQDLRETSRHHLGEGHADEVERSARRAAAANDAMVGSIDCAPDRASSLDRKPLHYKVICISMYTEDLQRLDRMVEALKSRGLTRANRSALIRHALSAVDLDRVPKGL